MAAPAVKALLAAHAAGGGGGFSPSDISGLVLWLDADAITGLNDGDGVAQWDDLSSGGKHVTQGTASQRPLYKTGIVNGLPVVRFDGSDDTLVNTSLGVVQPNTVFVVFDRGRPWETLSVNGGSGGRQIMGSHQLFAGSVVGSTPSTSQGTFQQFTSIFNGASSSLRTNGSAFSSGNAGSNGQVQLHMNYDGSNYFAGDVCELLCYSSALSVADVGDVESYLTSKWGL